jgi:hypothetical protein
MASSMTGNKRQKIEVLTADYPVEIPPEKPGKKEAVTGEEE